MGFFIDSHDKSKIYVHTWEDVKNPVGVVQIFHGMSEHGARYDEFARFLNGKGFVVFADDHRGHGKTSPSLDELGYLGEDGFNNIVKDEYCISNYIKEKYPNLPLYIFAHSFGSFVGQEYINNYSEFIDGIVLSGSAKQYKIAAKTGYLLSSLYEIIKKDKDKYKNKELEKIIFGSYNKKEIGRDFQFAWLSSDDNSVIKYQEDDFCGTIFTTNFYKHFFKGMLSLYKRKKSININKNLPIFIVAGDMDPVGSYGKAVKRLYKYYCNIGVKNVSIELYEGCRHELVNEKNKIQFFNDVYDWINKNIDSI